MASERLARVGINELHDRGPRPGPAGRWPGTGQSRPGPRAATPQACRTLPYARIAAKVRDDQSGHRSVMPGGGDPGIAVDLVRNRDRNTPHDFTVTQFPCFTVRSARQAGGEQADVVRAGSLALKHALGGVADL